MLPPKLDYLFIADFNDRSRYFQTPQDVSREHPLTRSAFWDVAQRLDQVTEFTLIDRHQQHEHTVFLSDGHFKSDGKIIVCPRNDLNHFRLIYFRRVEHKFENEAQFKPYIVGYFIGWQANDANGRNFQMILQVPPLGSSEKISIERKG